MAAPISASSISFSFHGKAISSDQLPRLPDRAFVCMQRAFPDYLCQENLLKQFEVRKIRDEFLGPILVVDGFMIDKPGKDCLLTTYRKELWPAFKQTARTVAILATPILGAKILPLGVFLFAVFITAYIKREWVKGCILSAAHAGSLSNRLNQMFPLYQAWKNYHCQKQSNDQSLQQIQAFLDHPPSCEFFKEFVAKIKTQRDQASAENHPKQVRKLEDGLLELETFAERFYPGQFLEQPPAAAV